MTSGRRACAVGRRAGAAPWKAATCAARASMSAGGQFAARERMARERILRKLAHPDRVFDDRSAAAERRRVDRCR